MTSRSRAGLLGAALFVGAQVVSLLANYGFQLLAARKLAPEAYVGLFGWLAELAAYGVLPVVATNVALTKPAHGPALRAGAGVVAVAALAGAFVFHGSVPLAPVVLAATAVGYATGLALERQAVLLVALGGAAVFLARLAWFVSDTRLEVGERSTLLGYGVGLAVLAVAIVMAREPAAARERAKVGEVAFDVVRAVVLSAAQAVAPVADYLLVRAAVPDAEQAAFASASLLVRVPVVLGMGVLQVTLAKRLAAERTGEPLVPWVRTVEIAMPALLAVVGLLPTAVFARAVALVVGGGVERYLGVPFGRMTWSAGATLAVLALLQIAHARREVRVPALSGVVTAITALGIAHAPLGWEGRLAAVAALWTAFAAALAFGLRWACAARSAPVEPRPSQR